MPLDDLHIDVRSGVARIAFNRPARRNALGETTTRQLAAACNAVGADPAVRVIVLTGEGDAFCAGGDFKDTFARGAGQTAAQWSERIRCGPNGLVRLLQTLRQPVVASINGPAFGGGATIALACDLRIASDRACMAFPFARLGITPEFGCSHLLPRIVGLGRAMELLLLAEPINAHRALALGLVNQVVPHAELDAATNDLTAKLLAMPARAQARIKVMLYHAMNIDIEAALEQEARELGDAFTSVEHKAAVAAFLARQRTTPSAVPST